MHRSVGKRSFLATVDQIEIATVDKYTCGLSENEYRIATINRIEQEKTRARDAQIPENNRDHAFSSPFTGYPLNKKPHGKQYLGRKTQT